MTTQVPLETETPWFRLEVGEEGWAAEDPVRLARMLEQAGWRGSTTSWPGFRH